MPARLLYFDVLFDGKACYLAGRYERHDPFIKIIGLLPIFQFEIFGTRNPLYSYAIKVAKTCHSIATAHHSGGIYLNYTDERMFRLWQLPGLEPFANSFIVHHMF